MKKIKALLIEIIILTFFLSYLIIVYLGHLKSIIICLLSIAIIILAVIIAKVIESLMDLKLKKLAFRKEMKARWRAYYLLGFMLVSIEFFIIFIVITYIGKIPMTTKQLTLLSIDATSLHMLISSILDVVVDPYKKKTEENKQNE